MISRYAMEVVVACATAAAAVLIGWSSHELGIGWSDAGPESGYFPFYISVLLLLGSLGSLARAVAMRRRLAQPFIAPGHAAAVAIFALTLLGLAVLCTVAGMYPAVAVYLAALTWWRGGLAPYKAAALGGGVAAFLFVAFEYAFQLPLPKGPLLNLLGIY
ncbi:tripartite tricarboxylate transporter TctB family protein [Bordetella petrii]|uniref:tripartite tricarboxylate transporter TctB family protein n=1 Tax=Bordetella petrii TaxID=94624 RepID=UPI001E3A6ECB|nr:tripartite tricarboxylate transporter TctB family protein [Bordetella petrii]MCD0503974.1 tripartite tricarboxylate transporter TctB family protein [Bordetella petrii]